MFVYTCDTNVVITDVCKSFLRCFWRHEYTYDTCSL